MFETLWMLLGVSNWWKRLMGSLAATIEWVGQSPFHLVLAGLLASLAANGWQRHARDAEAGREAKEMAGWQKAFATEQGAFRAEQQMAGGLRAGIAGQNASIEELQREGAARVAAARAALAAAMARDAGNASLSARIGREAEEPSRAAATLSPEAGCRTPEAVMAARGVL